MGAVLWGLIDAAQGLQQTGIPQGRAFVGAGTIYSMFSSLLSLEDSLESWHERFLRCVCYAEMSDCTD